VLISRSDKLIYFASASSALLIASFCTAFSLSFGLGLPYLLPTAFALLCLVFGIASSFERRRIGARFTGIGTSICGVAIVGYMIELFRAIWPQQPGLITLLIFPAVLVCLLLFHCIVAATQSGLFGNSF
jgi:hypothetical protein